MSSFDLTDQYSQSLISKLEELSFKSKTKIDLEKIKKAMLFAKKYHDGQNRDSGEPYYSHPIRVAEMVCNCCFKTDVVIASLLHDTLEDTIADSGMIEEEFGHRVSLMVEGVTRIKLGEKITSEEMFRVLYKYKDKEAILIKVCDRIHNVQTISAKNPEKQKKIIEETVTTFISFCVYLEIPELRDMLIKLCYEVLDIEYIEEQSMNFDNNYKLSPLFQNMIFPK